MNPLFILGAHRSGTTWVANALCNHSQIFGVQSAAYGGIKESWFFSHLDGRFGDITGKQGYARLIDAFQCTAFFQVSGVPQEFFQTIQPESYADFFDQFMRRAAQHKRNAAYWLEKTPVHTLYLSRLVQYYPKARFIAVARDVEHVVISAWHLKYPARKYTSADAPFFLLRLLFHWLKYQCYVHHFSSRFPDRFFKLNYSNLKSDPKNHFLNCLTFLGLDWEDTVLEMRYAPNTSFSESALAKNLALPKPYLVFLRAAAWCGGCLPYDVFALHERIRAPRNKEPIPYSSPIN